MGLSLEKFKNEQKNFILTLTDEEMSENTIKKYSLGIRTFIEYSNRKLSKEQISKNFIIEYKQELQSRYTPNTINLYISGLNRYLKYLKHPDLCVKAVNIQSHNSLENCITHDEYKEMLSVAKAQKNNDIYYIMRTIANTGIRVSELKFITVESVKKKQCTISNKGKVRYIVISDAICKELLGFCKEKGIESGYIFFARNPNVVVSEVTVLRRLKRIALLAGVDKNKAYPHNFRHFFAKTYMEKYKNVVELADILGHRSLEATRIYTRTSNAEKRKKLKNLGL